MAKGQAKLLAGYSHMIYQITNGKLSLDDFELPNGCYLEPVKHTRYGTVLTKASLHPTTSGTRPHMNAARCCLPMSNAYACLSLGSMKGL